jgi:transposase
MSRPRLILADHFTLEELETRYRQAQDPIARSHWQIIWLFHQYQNADTIATLTAYTDNWIRKLIKRYNQHGEQALGDLRHHNPGEPRILTKDQQEQLRQALSSHAEGHSLWTSARVAIWIEQKTGQKVTKMTGWKYLKRLDQTLQIPRPQHQKAASLEAQGIFKKNSNKTSKT